MGIRVIARLLGPEFRLQLDKLGLEIEYVLRIQRSEAAIYGQIGLYLDACCELGVPDGDIGEGIG